MNKQIKRVLAGAAVIVAVIAAYECYVQNQRIVKEQLEKQDAEAERYYNIAWKEAAWIKKQQLDDGAVLVYEPDADGDGYINPYFACQAMLGLITDPSFSNIDAVRKYLNWHTATLISDNGRICDYDYKNGSLISKDEADSVDSYIAEYLLLLTRYYQTTGTLDDIENWEMAVNVTAQVLQSLNNEKVVYVNDDHEIAYLMDNTEVYEASVAMDDMLSSMPDAVSASGLKDARFAFRYLRRQLEFSIDKVFWDKNRSVYIAGIDSKGQPSLEFDVNDFYPSAIAQLYPAITGQRVVDSRERYLYDLICENHAWERGRLVDTTFDWSVMSYAAAVFGDTERVDKYLDYYVKAAKESRQYPMHTANAGWIMRCCDLRIGQIHEVKTKNIFEYYFDEWFGKD